MTEHNRRPFIDSDAAEFVSQFIRTRRKRKSLFSNSLFSDPAWDILLVLFLADLRSEQMAITDVARATAIPLATTIRWIETLEQKGWALRLPDRVDRRRVFARLSKKGSEAMHGWLNDWFENEPDDAGGNRISDLLARLYRGSGALSLLMMGFVNTGS